MKIYLFTVRCWETGTNRKLWERKCVATGYDPFEAWVVVWDRYKSAARKNGLTIKRCNQRGAKMPYKSQVIICE